MGSNFSQADDLVWRRRLMYCGARVCGMSTSWYITLFMCATVCECVSCGIMESIEHVVR